MLSPATSSLKLRKGFTLVEIVIVLAIAAMIMVVVFFAVSGAQRSQRDGVRKDISQRTKAQYEQAKSNNDGNYPAVDNTFADTYMNASAGSLQTQGITFTWDGVNPLGGAGTPCTAATPTDAVIVANTTGGVGVCLEVGTWYRAN